MLPIAPCKTVRIDDRWLLDHVQLHLQPGPRSPIHDIHASDRLPPFSFSNLSEPETIPTVMIV